MDIFILFNIYFIGDNMNLIKMYINKLTKDDIYKYISNNNYLVNDDDINIIYFYIKNYYEEFFKDPDSILNKIKKDVDPNTFSIILDLYNKYKKGLFF